MSAPPAGPGLDRATPSSRRAPAPDLARGTLLLLICLANVHLYLYRDPLGLRGYPTAQRMSEADRVVAALQTLLVDGRAFPMFGMLVG
ncbi:hypothetical protein [Kineococcus sp. SYSU DK003]|uniref:hypothetical protein n=1 Tax=Kineococcus sp. SYSU DK003 TaxID=3383124 RepID=UPI003D7E7CFB